MAKVIGPLHSIEASQSFGTAMTFMQRKGQSIVRKWTKPANPKTAGQGNQRTMYGGVGKAVAKLIAGCAYETKLAAAVTVPTEQTNKNYVVAYILNNYLTNTTTFASELAACTGHTAYTSFGALATTLGIGAFSLAYDTIAEFDKALGLFLMAKTGIALGFTGDPYTSALSAWTKTDVETFGGDITGV